MADVVQVYLLENRTIEAYINGYPYTFEGGFRIVAGEKNATKFHVVSRPTQYSGFTLNVSMTNSMGEDVTPPSIENNQFMLPIGMAVSGYGQIVFSLTNGSETVVFVPLKVKVWNTDLRWKIGIINVVPLEIGTVETLPPGSSATVVNVGSQLNPVLNFGIPQGESGAGSEIAATVQTQENNTDKQYPMPVLRLSENGRSASVDYSNKLSLNPNKGSLSVSELKLNGAGNSSVSLKLSNTALGDASSGLSLASSGGGILYFEAPRIYEQGQRVYSKNNEPPYRMTTEGQVSEDKIRNRDYILRVVEEN